MNENHASLLELKTNSLRLFNSEQKSVFDRIDNAGDSKGPADSHIFFVNASAGTGKTLVAKTLLASAQLRGDIALPCASSGIAALLFRNGKTVRSMEFQFLRKTPVCLPSHLLQLKENC